MFFSKVNKSISDLKQQLRSQEFLDNYNIFNLALANYAVIPLKKLLLHLLSVQGLDPNSQPGDAKLKYYRRVLENFFVPNHERPYDEDFSWSKKQFDVFRHGKHHNDLELTEEQFKKATDITHWSCPTPPKNTDTIFIKATTGIMPAVQETLSAINTTKNNSLPNDPISELSDLLNPSVNLNVASKQEEHKCETNGSTVTENCTSDDYDTSVLREASQSFNKAANELENNPTADLLAHIPELKKVLERVKEYADRQKSRLMSNPLYKEANAINDLLLTKMLHLVDLPLLVKEGVKQEVVDFWYKHFHTEFEASTKKELGDFGGTFKRVNTNKSKDCSAIEVDEATALVKEMVARGLLSESDDAFKAQLQQVLSFDSNSFQALKKIVLKHKLIDQNSEQATVERFNGSFSRSIKS